MLVLESHHELENDVDFWLKLSQFYEEKMVSFKCFLLQKLDGFYDNLFFSDNFPVFGEMSQ